MRMFRNTANALCHMRRALAFFCTQNKKIQHLKTRLITHHNWCFALFKTMWPLKDHLDKKIKKNYLCWRSTIWALIRPPYLGRT